MHLLVPAAATVNVAVNLRARARVRAAPRFSVRNPQRGVAIEADRPGEFHRNRFTALAGRLLDAFRPPDPVEIEFETAAPAGSGLGGSSALGMALAAALNDWTAAGWTATELARVVMDAEVRLLRASTGSQDHFAAAFGGARAHHWESPAPRSEPLPWGGDGDGEDPMADRFVLAYTGQAHSSAEPNRKVLRRIMDGEPEALDGIERIAKAAEEVRQALLSGDWDRVAAGVEREWEGRRLLHPAVATPTQDRFERALREAGARAVKACGAGGGGTLLALFRPEDREAGAAAVRAAGGEVLEARTDRRGLVRE